MPSFRQGRIILRARSQAHMSGCRSRWWAGADPHLDGLVMGDDSEHRARRAAHRTHRGGRRAALALNPARSRAPQ